ncbi:MAG: methyltransferase [Pseudomonadota bacterium]
MTPDAGTTIDTICRGALDLEQPQKGYRFNVDSVILARFAARATPEKPDTILDLGAGCGVVGLLLARMFGNSLVHLLEIQPELASFAKRNIVRNGLEDRVNAQCNDLRELKTWPTLEGKALVVCNPPFHSPQKGRISPVPQVAMARHEIACTLEDLVCACAAKIPESGHLALIHDADRREEVLSVLTEQGFSVKNTRAVHPFADRPATRVLVLAYKGEHGTQKALSTDDQPLIVAERPGKYTRELEEMLEVV